MQFAELGVYDGFNDDFTSGFANNWTTAGGQWTAASGMYTQSQGASAVTAIPQSAWSDATFEYDVRIDSANGNSANWAGANFRKAQLSDGHGDSGYLVICRANGQVALSSPAAVLASFSSGVTFDRWTHIKIVASGNNIQVFVANSPTPQLTHTDAANAYATGYFGFETGGASASYDNVAIH